jgi:hypothetical protein
MARDDADGNLRELGGLAKAAESFDPVVLGHRKVQGDDVGLVLSSHLDCFGAVFCLAKLCASVGKHSEQERADVFFVIYDENTTSSQRFAM